MNPGGVLLIDKPTGISSFAVVRQLRKITGIRKIGHAGTLDPFASGLLVMCLGFATRIAGRLLLDDKTYVVKMKLGTSTDTGDLTGEIIDSAEPPVLTEEKLTETASAILRIREQTPPRYSAVKVGGRRAYQLARNNQEFTLLPRSVEIKNFSFTGWEAGVLEYVTTVSKGTYIRVLSETIAGLLGTRGVTTYLRRIQAGCFRVEDA
ncbi:MAG: tRNA pseudouridine(55) synthase TruB, partial [Candidatus Cloacimonetes bacterium]|nr:tRNA pseudouridine(55) synthase TruB [Candidatus Cloacimonadota bacterium]